MMLGAYAEGSPGRAGCGEYRVRENAQRCADDHVHRIARYRTEDEGVTPRARRACNALSIESPPCSAGRQRQTSPRAHVWLHDPDVVLDGADAQALEGAPVRARWRRASSVRRVR